MWWLLLAYLTIWLVWMPLRFVTRKQGHKALSTVCKVIPTLLAASLAGWACLFGPAADWTAWLLFGGIAIGACADAALEIRFQVGGALFFIAHCLFVAAMVLLSPPSGWLIAISGAAFVGAALFLSRYRPHIADAKLRRGITLYAVALSALLGAALPAPFVAGGSRAAIGALGAALFVLSDATLCHNTVSHRMARAREAVAGGLNPVAERRRIRMEALSLGCYYTAQVALALCAAAPALLAQ